MSPKISVITINYNNLSGLKRSVESVWAQTFQDIEFIIIDGGSNDGAREFLQENSERFTYWISEKDNGVFNAQNKGWLQAKGEYLYFLNSGDALFSTTTLNDIVPHLDGTGIVYGNLLKEEPAKEWVKQYNKPLSLHYFYWETLPHQGAFIEKSLLDAQNGYDENLRLTSDWKFFLQAVCRQYASTKYVDTTIARYNLDGMSGIEANQQKLRAEREQVWLREWPMQYKTVQALLQEQEKNVELRKKIHQMADSRLFRIYSWSKKFFKF